MLAGVLGGYMLCMWQEVVEEDRTHRGTVACYGSEPMEGMAKHELKGCCGPCWASVG